MKLLRKHLEKLRKIKRREYHPSIHQIRNKYGISKRTLLYVKEYGPHSNVPKNIIKESLKILLFASILSSIGGLALEHIKGLFISFVPLIILLPVLNDMIGDYSIIVSSRFTTLLHTGKIKNKWYKNSSVNKIFLQILIISLLTASIGSLASLIISHFSGYALNLQIIYKIFLISIIDTFLLVGILFMVAIYSGYHYYRKNEDPNNFLIPLTTSLADLGNMLVLSILIILFF